MFNLLKLGLFLENNDFIFALARSLRAFTSSGTLMEPSVSGDLGRLTVSVWAEIKMGAPIPFGGLGRLGIGTVGFSLEAGRDWPRRRFFFLCSSSRCLWSSLNLALNGLGRLNLMGLILTDGESLGEIDGWNVAEPRLTLEALVGAMALDDPRALDAPTELLNLLWPRLRRLELARKPDLELLPKAGVA